MPLLTTLQVRDVMHKNTTRRMAISDSEMSATRSNYGSKTNPYLLGKNDGNSGTVNCNPFELFSDKWALYNRGYNSICNPWMSKAKKEDKVLYIPA